MSEKDWRPDLGIQPVLLAAGGAGSIPTDTLNDSPQLIQRAESYSTSMRVFRTGMFAAFAIGTPHSGFSKPLCAWSPHHAIDASTWHRRFAPRPGTLRFDKLTFLIEMPRSPIFLVVEKKR
jgi:hypothetical protein